MDSLNKEWHNKIEEAKDNLKNWEESLQSFLHFEDRPQLFDSHWSSSYYPSHAVAVKYCKMFLFSAEFLNSKPSIDQIQKLIEVETKVRKDIDPGEVENKVRKYIDPREVILHNKILTWEQRKKWRPNQK